MTGFRCHKLNHDCTTKGCYIDMLPWWCDLFEAFPRSIRATDVDGFVEINGHFLFLEEKRKEVPFGEKAGQFKALRRLSSLPKVTVVWFRPGVTSDYEFLIHDGGEPHKGECSKGQLIAWLSRWAQRAEMRVAS